MTRRLAVLFMLLVLASTAAFLYYMTKQGDGQEGWYSLDIIGGVDHSFSETAEGQVAGVETVDVSSVTADVTVKFGNTDRIEAKFWGDARFAKGSPMPRLSLVSDSGVIRIEVEPRGASGYRVTRSALNLEVTLPETYTGSLIAWSVSGSVTLDDSSLQAVSAESVSGSIKAGHIATQGKLSMITVSGSIDVESAAVGSLKADSVSGSIDLKEVTTQATVEIHTISGDAVLGLPSSLGFNLEAGTVSGRISCDIPLRIESTTSRSLVGTAGDGAALVDINTVSGSIAVKSR